MPNIEIREFTMEDYDEALALWRASEGISISAADSRENIQRFLARNPGQSFVARANGRLIGAVLGGHDGRRGFLHHLAVARDARRAGVGNALVARALDGLRAQRITRCHIFVHQNNASATDFWERQGWRERTDLKLMSRDIDAID
jgi:putative acetyltransferase